MSEKLSKGKLVMSTTKKIINSLSKSLDTSSTKASLAELRNSLGRPLDQSLNALKVIFENMPEEISGYGRELTREELAIFTSLQLYASYQQGRLESVDYEGKEGQWNNVGHSLSFLRSSDASNSTDERFNAMITSQSFEELVIHLRHMLKLLKSKNKDVKVNFTKLSYDLYSHLCGYDNSIRINWSRAYYSNKEKKETNEKQGE